MKALKIFCNVIIGIILFALIFSLIFIRETNKIISSDVLKESINNFVADVKSEGSGLTKSQEELINDIFEDKDAKEVARIIFKNYKEYRNNEDYSITIEDAKTIYEFIYKHRDDIKESKIEHMTDEEFKEYFNYDKINEMANKSFTNFDKIFDSKVIDRIINSYSFATSYFVRLAILFTILLMIVLLCIINVSLIKWMVVFGFSLIASGMLFSLLYFAAEFIREVLIEDNNINIVINLNPYIFAGIIQIILGIALIVIYVLVENKYKNIENNETKDIT